MPTPSKSAYSVVVGQIHSVKNAKAHTSGFGYGNEPIKVFYKKWPGHQTGSVFWTYERNLPKDHPDRTDLDHVVWGNSWDNSDDPGAQGIALGQQFSYRINVIGNQMRLTFDTTDPSQRVTFSVDLSNNIGPSGWVDEKDNPGGYAQDSLYFKAGAYNQCSSKDSSSFRYPACAGTGDWETDKTNGDYVSVAFQQLHLSRPSAQPKVGTNGQ